MENYTDVVLLEPCHIPNQGLQCLEPGFFWEGLALFAAVALTCTRQNGFIHIADLPRGFICNLHSKSLGTPEVNYG